MNFQIKWKIEKFIKDNKEFLISEMKNTKYNFPVKVMTFIVCNPFPYLYPLAYGWGFWVGTFMSTSSESVWKIILLFFSFFLLLVLTSSNLSTLWKMIKNPVKFFKKIYYWFLTEQALSLNTFRMLKDVLDENELIHLIKENGKLTYKDIFLDENDIYSYFYNKKIQKREKYKLEKRKMKEDVKLAKVEMLKLNKEKGEKENSEKIENFVKSLYKED